MAASAALVRLPRGSGRLRDVASASPLTFAGGSTVSPQARYRAPEGFIDARSTSLAAPEPAQDRVGTGWRRHGGPWTPRRFSRGSKESDALVARRLRASTRERTRHAHISCMCQLQEVRSRGIREGADQFGRQALSSNPDRLSPLASLLPATPSSCCAQLYSHLPRSATSPSASSRPACSSPPCPSRLPPTVRRPRLLATLRAAPGSSQRPRRSIPARTTPGVSPPRAVAAH